MTRSKRMSPVVKVAATREQEAARLMGEAQRALEQREARLAELVAYQQEYVRRFQTVGSGGVDVARLQDFRVFLARLDEAIGQQRRLVEVARQEYQARHRAWADTRIHAKAVDKVVDRYQRDEQRVQHRREQRELDEHAAQKRSPVEPD